MPPESSPSILVVIPTLDEALHIESVLTQLALGLPADGRVRFAVCDGGSRDGTQAIVERLARSDDRIVLMGNPQRLQSAAVNRAVRALGAGVEIVIRCDAHSVYPRGYIADLVATLARTGADAVVVPMDSIGDGCLRRAIAWVSDTPVGSGGAAHRGGRYSGFVDHGHHAAFRMQAFVAAGGYDESFSHNEDAELDCRQRALGARIYLDGELRIGYVARDNLGGLWRQYQAYGRGRSRTVRRHPHSFRLRQFAVPAHLALSLLALALLPWFHWPALWPGLYLGVLLLTSIGIALKNRSTCGLLAGPAAFVMHTAYALGFFAGLMQHRETRWSVDSTRKLQLDPDPAA